MGNKGNALTTFVRLMFSPSMISRISLVPRSIVAGHQDEGVVQLVFLSQEVDHFAQTPIQFLHGIPVNAGTRGFLKLFRSVKGIVRKRLSVVEKKGLF